MNIIENVKSVAKTLQQMDNIELYKQILDIQSQALELLEENRTLKDENYELRERIKIKKSLLFENNMYWIEKDNKKEGPFCSRCWDMQNRLVRMHIYSGNYCECPACKVCIR